MQDTTREGVQGETEERLEQGRRNGREGGKRAHADDDAPGHGFRLDADDRDDGRSDERGYPRPCVANE